MSSPSIAFRNPPINEVVVSTYFNPSLSGLRSEHIGLFWGEIKQDFPVVSQHPPVGTELDVRSKEAFPMPRYWFISEDEINLIQVQKNAFMFNWRGRNEEYPRFHKDIKPTFDKYYGRFGEFIKKETEMEYPTIDLCELAYINAVKQCEDWNGVMDTSNIIPSFSILNIGAVYPDPVVLNCNYIYRISNNLQINVRIRSAVMAQDENVPVLIFEIRASGRLGQVVKSGADEWFEQAHDAIINCFLDMTSQDIQNNLWQRVEETQ